MDFYDSDQSFSQRQSDACDFDDKSFREEEKQTLLDKINELTKQNTVLKAQFEQAISTTKQMNEVMLKNSNQNAEIRKLINERDQLQNRLEISLRSNEEFTQRLENEKSSNNQQLLQLSSEKDVEVSNVKKQCTAKLDAMMIRVGQLEDTKEQLETQVKTLLSKISKLNQVATKFFEVSFDGIDSLTSFFQQSLLAVPNVPVEPPRQVPFEQEPPLVEADNSKYKKKINTLKKHCEKFVSKIQQLQNELNASEEKNSKEIASYKNQIAELKNEITDSAMANSQTIQQLEGSNKILKDEVQKLKKDNMQQANNLTFLSHLSYTSQNSSPPEQPKPQKSKEESALKKKIVEIKKVYDASRQENEKLKTRIKSLEQSNRELTTQVNEFEIKQSDLSIQISRLEKEKSTAEIIHNETQKELQSVRELLHSKSDQNENNNDKNKKEIEKLKKSVEQLETMNKKQKELIHTQELENQNLKNENESMQKTLELTQNENKELDNKVHSLNDDLIEAREQLQSKPEITVEDILPPSSFRFQGFDPSLADKIECVINTSFSPSIKLSKIYSVIMHHFDKIIKEKEDSVTHMTSHLQSIKNQLNKFFVDLSLLLSLDAVTFDDMIERNKSETILSKVSVFCQGYEDLKRKNTELNVIVERINDEFGQSTDVPSYISCIRQKYENQTNTLKKQIKKYQEVKKSNKLLKKKADSTISVLEQQNAKLTSELCDLKAQNAKLTNKLHSAKCEINNMKSQFESIKNSNEHTEESIRSEHDQIVQTISQNFLSEKSQLMSQIEKIKADNEKLKETITEHEATIIKLKSIIQKHRNELKEYEETPQLKDIPMNNSDELRKRFDIEKSQLIQTYENAISEIQKQLGNHRQDSEKISSDLKLAQNKLAHAQSANSKLKKEKQKLEDIIKDNEEQMERERKIQQVTTQNQLATLQSKYSQMIEDTKAKCESDKLKIFSFAADEFKRFRNQCESINERSYRSLITRVRKELDRLTESDSNIRKMANAVPKQSTDDAVSKMLIC